MNHRKQNYDISVKSGQPLKFTVGVKHLCTHADMVTFEMEDRRTDKQAGYGLHFLWRQIGGKFEVHQSDREDHSESISFDWNVGKPRDESRATVTIAGDIVNVEHDKNPHKLELCSRDGKRCSFTREKCDGEDVFHLSFTNIDDQKCGLFFELDKNDGRLLTEHNTIEHKHCKIEERQTSPGLASHVHDVGANVETSTRTAGLSHCDCFNRALCAREVSRHQTFTSFPCSFLLLGSDGMVSARHGSYDVNGTPIELRTMGKHRISVLESSAQFALGTPGNRHITFGNNRQPRSGGLLARCRMYADDFRGFVANTCCSCVEAVPSFALVILAVLIIMLLIAVVPLAFALTYSNAAQKMDVTTLLPPLSDELDNITMAANSTEEEEAHGRLLMSTALIPKNISACHGFGFACASNPSKVIGTYQRCDGHLDCPDGSDEIECRECQTSFSCDAKSRSEDSPIHKACFRGQALCDGSHQCDDHTDELLYCKGSCKDEQLACRNSTVCVPESMVCDGDAHCPFADDEQNCAACVNGAKLCVPRRECIPKWRLCDGVVDCPDHSDELDCDCRSCSGSDRALCTGSTSRCLLKSNVCDGQEDCPGGEDEEQCPGSCPSFLNNTTETTTESNDIDTSLRLVECSDDRSYTWKYACSGLVDACQGRCEECNEELAFRCNIEKRCVHRSKVCNGIRDCSDGSDEENCECGDETSGTGSGEDACSGDSMCLRASQRCDGFYDCSDGSDERECESCSKGAIFCAQDRSCFSSLKRCDGVEDCSDGSDEANCTCQECNAHPFAMYVCQAPEAGRCFRRHEACSPYSRCPDATKMDKLFCAASFQIKRAFF
ncbi:low-density lipoprotein receptor domain class A containing protein [Aphelenchoides avenae]|nr:low-density lipoprotein receptor domain class A containing protein [Aphelenchus avenae]